jgi:hypothetical protein
MTVQEIEQACAEGRPLDFSRHEIEPPPPSHRKTFHPYGFPVAVHCDEPEVFKLLDAMWGRFKDRIVAKKIQCEVFIEPSGLVPCPATPGYRLLMPHLFTTVDSRNFCVADLERGTVRICMTEGVLRHRRYASYFMLWAPLACIAAKHATSLHAACVSWRGHGTLLCGDSGAGKSTLAYACARAGWTYTSDDVCYLTHNERAGRMVIGNPHQLRFRPETAQLFPELGELRMTPRAVGKPTAELAVENYPNLRPRPTAHVDSIVFLCRDHVGPPTLEPYSEEVARQIMRQSVYGTSRMLKTHYAVIDRLLQAPVYKLSYTTLSEGIGLLRRLAEDSSNGLRFAAAD